jgi:hypothetical protein
VGRCGLDSSVSGYRAVAGCCERGDEPMGSIRGGGDRVAGWLLLSREGLCSMELVTSGRFA